MKKITLILTAILTLLVSVLCVSAAAPVMVDNSPNAIVNLTAQNTAQTFTIDVTDGDGDNLTVLWYLNNVLQENDTLIGSGVASYTNTFANSTINSGADIIKVKVTDSNSTNWLYAWVVNVPDTENPSIFIKIPSLDGQVIKSTNNITIGAILTDNINVSNCSLYLNNVFNQTVDADTSGKDTTASFPLTYLNEATYSYYVTCLDSSGNQGIIATRTFEIDRINDAPFISAVPDKSVATNRNLSFQIVASDSNNDDLTFTCSDSGALKTFSCNSTGYVTYVPSATLENFTAYVTVSDTTNGTDTDEFNVEVKNPEADITVTKPSFDEETRKDNATATFYVINSGDHPLTNVTISTDAFNKYDITFSQTTPFSLAVGDSKTVNIRAYVHEDLDSGTTDIGNIIVDSAETEEAKAVITLDAKNELEISDLDFESNEFTDVTSVHDERGTEVSASPGDEFTMVLELRNTFSKEDYYKTRITDVSFEIIIIDLDEGKNFKYEKDNIRLSAGERDPFEIDVQIPYEIKSDYYEVEITVTGKDSNNAEHSTEWKGDINVIKDSQAIEFLSIEMTPEEVTCENEITFDLEVINIGKYTLDNAMLQIESNDLFISEVKLFEIESYADDTRDSIKDLRYTFEIPEFTGRGTYKVFFTLYNDPDNADSGLTKIVTIRDCIIESTSPDTTDDIVDTTDNSDNIIDTTDDTSDEEESETSDATGVYVKRTYSSSGTKAVSSSIQKYDVIGGEKESNAGLIAAIVGANVLIIGGALAVSLGGGAGGAGGASAAANIPKTTIVKATPEVAEPKTNPSEERVSVDDLDF